MCRPALLACAALLVTSAAAEAVKPRPRAMVTAQAHNTGGGDWHVQLEVNRDSSRLSTVVAHSQRCKSTGFAARAPLGADGSFALVDVPFEDARGTWSVQGSFTAVGRAAGTWSVEVGGCTDGGEFVAQDATGHFLIGNPYEYAPQRILAASREARRLRLLQRETLRNARRFDTIAKARELGYELSTGGGCPGMHHARKHGTSFWGRVLDPTAPQSLIYWCDSQNRWTLAAFMYRAPADDRPGTYRDLLQWHRHTRYANWMTHVWLVRDPVAAFATCAPFPAFAAEGSFLYEDFVIDAQIDTPCTDSTA